LCESHWQFQTLESNENFFMLLCLCWCICALKTIWSIVKYSSIFEDMLNWGAFFAHNYPLSWTQTPNWNSIKTIHLSFHQQYICVFVRFVKTTPLFVHIKYTRVTWLFVIRYFLFNESSSFDALFFLMVEYANLLMFL
jgi:hypothetical protein